MLDKIKSLFHDKDFRRVIIIFLIMKALVILIAVGTQFFVPSELTHTQRVTDNLFLNPFAQYDSTAYLDIAQNGYNAEFGEGVYKVGNYHWYPLYPLLIRIFSFIGYPLAAFLIANVASFLAVAVLWLLVRDELGRKSANKTLIYILLFPTAFYFTMMYTESFFLLLSVSVFYFAKKGNWPLVGVLGFLASLTRIQGILLFIPVLIIYFKSVKFFPKRLALNELKIFFRTQNYRKLKANVLYMFAIPAGLATFMSYHWLTLGDPLIQLKSAQVFGRHLSWPWEGFAQAINAMITDTTFINLSYHIYNLFITVSFIALIWMAYKKLKVEYTVYFLLTMIILLFGPNLFGMSRYMLVVFPAFMALSLTDKKIKYGVAAAYAIFILLMAGFVVLHVTQRVSLPVLYTPLF